MNHKVGTDYSAVKFNAKVFDFIKFKLPVIESFENSFSRIGGTYHPEEEYIWKFPGFITFQVIDEIIHNTCFVCGGLMKDGQAIQNGEIRVPEEDVRGGYTPYVDTTNHSLIKVRKCTSCGHSHT